MCRYAKHHMYDINVLFKCRERLILLHRRNVSTSGTRLRFHTKSIFYCARDVPVVGSGEIFINEMDRTTL